MKQSINWKIFFILLVAGVIATLMVFPYTVALSPQLAKIMSPVLIVAQVIQALILFSFSIFIGLKLGKRVGLGLPILEAKLNKEKYDGEVKSVFKQAVLMGLLAGGLIVLFELLFYSVSLPLIKQEITIPAWKSLLASFYGGIGEEIYLRLFFMTLLVWIAAKIKKTPAGKPTTFGVWTAIIISSIVFGLGHLPVTGGVTAITPMVIFRAVLLNGVGGVIFGWLYYKKGLESAMISHFTADLVLHILFPAIMLHVLI